MDDIIRVTRGALEADQRKINSLEEKTKELEELLKNYEYERMTSSSAVSRSASGMSMIMEEQIKRRKKEEELNRQVDNNVLSDVELLVVRDPSKLCYHVSLRGINGNHNTKQFNWMVSEDIFENSTKGLPLTGIVVGYSDESDT